MNLAWIPFPQATFFHLLSAPGRLLWKVKLDADKNQLGGMSAKEGIVGAGQAGGLSSLTAFRVYANDDLHVSHQ